MADTPVGLPLDDEETVAVAVGLRVAAGQAVHGVGEASVRALGKLERVLPARSRERVDALAATTAAMPPPHEPRADPGVLTALAEAAANRERLRFAYESADGAASRLVEPHQVVAAGRRWYLIAYDTGLDRWRSFRADRITEPRATGRRYSPRELPGNEPRHPPPEKGAYVISPADVAVVTLGLPAEEVRRLGFPQGEVEPVGDAACRLRFPAEPLDWLAARLVMLGCEFEVHEPPELAAYLREAAGRALRATGG